MMSFSKRFSFLRWPLQPLSRHAAGVPAGTKLADHLGKAAYSVRLLRYWWAGQALAEEARKLGRPLVVVDLGCERGWLKHFTPPEAVGRWIGLDWNPREEARKVAGYDELIHANFDEPLPLESRSADAVVSLHVFEHLPRPGATLAEVSRLLREGGVFLGGAPTMPGFLAKIREWYFRRQLRQGKVRPGGHINCLSPSRWRRLASEVGLEVEFSVGSHLVRMTGGSLENFLPWVRANQLWGAFFPSLGSECYVRARREPAWSHTAVPLSTGASRPRLLWATAAVAACAVIIAGVLTVYGPSQRKAEKLDDWLSAHQTGPEHFMVLAADDIPSEVVARPDVSVLGSLDSAAARFAENHAARILVQRRQLEALAQSRFADELAVESRLMLAEADFYLLRPEDKPENSLRRYVERL